MRLPEAKIKEAILHPDKLVRQEALLYFGDCYSSVFQTGIELESDPFPPTASSRSGCVGIRFPPAAHRPQCAFPGS
jgi:hypothetical protein